MRRLIRAGLVALFLAAVGFVPAASAAGCVHTAYAIVELPGLGGPVTQAAGLADNGDASGYSLDAQWVAHAVRWSNGQVSSLSTSNSSAAGMSSNGTIAGSQTGRRGGQATTWFPSATLRPLRGSAGAFASDVNSSGLAVGWSTNSTGDSVAVRWDGGRAVSLATGSGAPAISLAFAVNDAGTIAGRGDFATAPFRRALKWTGTTMTVLPSLGAGVDSAGAISSSGLITGAGLSSRDSKFHAVVWNGNTVTDLGLFGTLNTQGYGVNACGTVVGDALVQVVDEITDAVIWQGGGSAVSLETLLPANHGWDLHRAVAINDAGQIVGHGYRNNLPGLRAFLMTPAN
jgi:uncharacterized membrane protein